jgi:4-amino-4-deoxy-L-arabinose transferase-like glycosyltransferase
MDRNEPVRRQCRADLRDHPGRGHGNGVRRPQRESGRHALASCVIAQGALAQIYVRARNGQAPGAVAADLWIAQGVGIIIKGPFTPLVSALTIGTLWIFERDGRWLRQLHVLRGLLIIAAIGLPWLVMTALRSGTAFLETSLGNDLLMKTVPGQQPHGAPPGYYVVTYSLFLWPFGVIALGAGLHALNRFREEPATAFCLAWYMPFWLLFELIPTKQPHHVLPAYPGLLLLVGWLATQTRGRRLGWRVAAAPVRSECLWSCRRHRRPCYRRCRRASTLVCPSTGGVSPQP